MDQVGVVCGLSIGDEPEKMRKKQKMDRYIFCCLMVARLQRTCVKRGKLIISIYILFSFLLSILRLKYTSKSCRNCFINNYQSFTLDTFD